MLGIIWFNREIKKVDFVEESSTSINFVNILVDFFRFSFVIMLFFKKPEINGLITLIGKYVLHISALQGLRILPDKSQSNKSVK